MKYNGIYVIIAILFLQCQNSNYKTISLDEIKETKWSIKIAEGCTNTLHFKNDLTYLEYNCEMEDTLFGIFKIEDEYLILKQEGSVYDKLYDEDSQHRIGKAEFKLGLQNEKLKFLEKKDFFQGKWVKSKHKFPEDYYYHKTK